MCLAQLLCSCPITKDVSVQHLDWLFVGQGATLTQQTVASSMALIPRLGDGNPFSFLSPVHGFIPIIWQPQDFEVEIITPIL